MSTKATPRGAAGLRAKDVKPKAQGAGPLAKAGGFASWVDDRTGAAKPVSYLLKKVFPDHWSFLLGEIAMFSLIIVLVTGTFLTFWYVPSAGQVIYNGSYVPLKGIAVSEAFKSTVDISFDVRGGLLMRQIHHWSALMFTASITVHMFRVFFTGAFRKPREVNWVIGTILSLLAINEGFVGYSLPDDLLSGTGLRVVEGFIQSIPVLGSYVAYFVFGGAFPGEAIIPPPLHRPCAPAAGHHCRTFHRAHRSRGCAQAHPVPRPGQNQRQRGRLPVHAGLPGQVRRLPVHRLRYHDPDLGLGHDQPDLDVRPV